MPTQDSIVRNSSRIDVSLRGLLQIAPESAAAVSFARAAGLKDGRVEVDVVDLSRGGVGVVSLHFVPRRCRVLVSIFGAVHGAAPIATVPCNVQRVCMTDRRPAYLIGAAFEDLTPALQANVNELLSLFEGTSASAAQAEARS
jgi:hypothetical protein